MKRDDLINILNNKFPQEKAYEGDFIGLQVEGKEEIKKILICLDSTLDIIYQALEEEVDMIISHHPLIFGEKDEIFKKEKFTKLKFEMLDKYKVNLFVIHTNSDFSDYSIATKQAEMLNLINIEQIDENHGVIAELKDPIESIEFVKEVKSKLDLPYEFRINEYANKIISRVFISSGASGLNIFKNLDVDLFIIGEVKHHEWVYASEHDKNVLEIGHFSEKVFKDMIHEIIKDKEIEIIEGDEQNGYKTI